MAVDPRRSEFEDPFADFSLLSLLPRTLGVALHADPPPSEAQEMESIKALLGSRVLNGSKEVREQALVISKSCQNEVNSSQDGDNTMAADGKDRPLGRRPALGRKRAQFSLKPLSSNPVPDVDFNSQIDHLDDPDEYFFAFEQLENADKELKKLRGDVPTEPAKNQQTTGRKRRPGILGKKVSYKHHFSAMVDATEVFSASQEDLDGITATPSKVSTKTKSNENLHPNSFDQPDNLDSMETDNRLFLATEQEDSVADKEENGDNLLEKLLSSFKDLNEDEGTAFLRESLQIKSIEVGKICLPELHTIQRNDFRTLDNRVTRKKSEVHQLPQTLPNLPRSPLAVISSLQRCISLNDPLEKPYMIPLSGDVPYSGDSCPTSCQQKKSLSPPVNVSYPDQNGLVSRDASVSAFSDDRRLSLVDKLQTPVTEADKIINDKIATEEEVTKRMHNSPGSTIEHRCHRMTDDQSNFDGFNQQMEEEGNHIQLDPLYERPNPEVEDPASGCTDHSARNGLANTIESTTEDHMLSESETDADKCGVDDNLQNQVNVGVSDVLVAGAEASIENSIPSTTVLSVSEQSKDVCIAEGENIEGQGHCSTSGIPQNNEKKQKASTSRKSRQNLVSRRQSLADAGMMWESGVRRSTRIKSRPLQYWRGERFLYGRIHDSLATVIGVKYASPGEDAALKVKSFVSEKYADLVAQAALY